MNRMYANAFKTKKKRETIEMNISKHKNKTDFFVNENASKTEVCTQINELVQREMMFTL